MDLTFLIDIVKVIGQGLFLFCAAYLATRFWFNRPKAIDFLLTNLVLFMGAVVVISAGLGFCGLLYYPYFLMTSVMVFLLLVTVTINAVTKAGGFETPIIDASEAIGFGWFALPLGIGFVATALAVGLLFPPTAFDSLAYHLFFPARWLQEGQIFFVPAVFGDMARTYGPCNGELTFAFWSAATMDDTFSRVGQFPFLIIAGASVFALMRGRGFSQQASALPTLFAVLTPTVFREGFSAEVELVMGASFVAALYYLDCYRRQPGAGNSVLFGICLGICIGTRQEALFYCVLLLVPFLIFNIRRIKGAFGHRLLELAMFVFAALLCGGFWYVRNWIYLDNPLFPLDLQPFFAGVYNRTAMLNSSFHVPAFKFIPLVWLYAYGPVMGAAFLFCFLAVAKWWVFRTEGRHKVEGFAAYYYLLPLIFASAHFTFVPHDSKYRLLIPAIIISFLPLAHMEGAGKYKWPFRILILALLALNTVGLSGIGLFQEARVAAISLTPVPYLPYVLVALAISLDFFFLLRKCRISTYFRVFATFIVVFIVVLFALPACFSGKPRQIIHIRNQLNEHPLVRPWAFVNNLAPSTIAYSGTNAPYYLLGSQWQHRVVYVRIFGQQQKDFYDYFLECQTKGTCLPPGKSDQPIRMWRRPNLEEWQENLYQSDADYFFVAAMAEPEPWTMAVEDENFPIEKLWAEQSPEYFTRIYHDERAAVYKINQRALIKKYKF